ncbi:MAG: peroxidase family protein [Gammaproteobacteria bacterium]|nr:peroxidase family protein [Gammaproteobacteria bacterium]
MKQELRDLITPITGWYTGSAAIEQSSLSRFDRLDQQLQSLKRYLEQLFHNEALQGDYSPDEIKAIRSFYDHVDELDLWHVMISPKTVKSITTSENIDLKRLKVMSVEILDMLKGKVDPKSILDKD